MLTLNRSTVFSLLLLALLAGSSKSAKADYAGLAEAETGFIQAHFCDASTGRFYSSYPNGRADTDALGCGIELSLLSDSTRYDQAKYTGMLHSFADGLSTYWNPTGPVPGFNTTAADPANAVRLYDDNARLAIDLADAYASTRDPKYLQLAWAAQNFAASGWDDSLGGGIYSGEDRKSKSSCANAAAIVAALRLAELSHNRDQVTWAMRTRSWLNDTLQAPNGLYWECVDKSGKITTTIGKSTSALMIWANVLLYQQLGDSSYLSEARRIADVGLVTWTDPETGSLQSSGDSPLFTDLFCESLVHLYVASRDIAYLNAVRGQASFMLRHQSATSGGYYDQGITEPTTENQRQSLTASATTTHLFWMLSPYPDVTSLEDSGEKAVARGDLSGAELLYQEAAASDRQDIVARYHLWRVLSAEVKADDAASEKKELLSMAKSPENAQQLVALGWSTP